MLSAFSLARAHTSVHCMRPGTEFDSMRLAVFIVSPSSVYLLAFQGFVTARYTAALHPLQDITDLHILGFAESSRKRSLVFAG